MGMLSSSLINDSSCFLGSFRNQFGSETFLILNIITEEMWELTLLRIDLYSPGIIRRYYLQQDIHTQTLLNVELM